MKSKNMFNLFKAKTIKRNELHCHHYPEIVARKWGVNKKDKIYNNDPIWRISIPTGYELIHQCRDLDVWENKECRRIYLIK